MSIAKAQGAVELATAGAKLRLLTQAPLIAPARQYVFPIRVPGEEEALSRGSIFVQVASAGGFLAQCAIGFIGSGVAHGLWPSPVAGEALVAAGGYVYRLRLAEPERTVLLPLRPAVAMVSDETANRAILIGYHHALVLEADGTTWLSRRLSWEGVAIDSLAGDELRGTGWDMLTDEEVAFCLNLRTQELTGGGYRQG